MNNQNKLIGMKYILLFLLTNTLIISIFLMMDLTSYNSTSTSEKIAQIIYKTQPLGVSLFIICVEGIFCIITLGFANLGLWNFYKKGG